VSGCRREILVSEDKLFLSVIENAVNLVIERRIWGDDGPPILIEIRAKSTRVSI
jgi:hypothetical protein